MARANYRINCSHTLVQLPRYCNITVCIHSNGFILAIVFTASFLVRHRFPMYCYSFITITLILLSSLVLCQRDRLILLAKTCQCACVSIICMLTMTCSIKALCDRNWSDRYTLLKSLIVNKLPWLRVEEGWVGILPPLFMTTTDEFIVMSTTH
jgi:hypothetical protein